ncbi:uncharacterized protein RJT21DRAFT_51627 [Scheffersomyces amazonensis]|uniref:uncharacterized protein n=1 Tax=Scheffersomyces amazonensis TaxID=1078765 RepID=UPI00315D8082
MISRCVLRRSALSQIRFNSTKPSGSDGKNPIFLSELLKRIDSVTANVKKQNDAAKSRANRNHSSNQPSKQFSDRFESQSQRPVHKKLGKQFDKKSEPSSKPIFSKSSSPLQERVHHPDNNFIRFANHPLREYKPRGDFSSRPQSNYTRADSTSRLDEPSNQRPSRYTRPQFDNAARSARPERPTRAARPKSDTPRKPRATKSSDREAFKKPSVAEPIVQKGLPKPQPLTPSINGDTFLYGKVPSANHTLNSRLISLTKETLIKSKYPYLVSPTILSSLGDDSKNKFIVQKNWDLNIDESRFQKRFSELVKGDVQALKVVQTSNQELNDFTASEIMKNASLSHEKKQLVYDVINGAKSIKDLVGKDAAWLKQ